MNHNSMGKVKITGIDWMISYIGWRSRNLPLQKNNFSVAVDVPASFCFEKLCSHVASLKELKTFLSGSVKRLLPCWEPFWYWQKNGGEGIICEKNISGTELEITNMLPRGTALKIVYFEKAGVILFTFCHAVFDGVGAEIFISQLLQQGVADGIPFRELPVDIPAMKKSGRELQKVMKQFPEKEILRLPGGGSGGKNVFDTIRLTPGEYRQLLENVECKYGPFSFSIFIFALILCNLEEHLFSGIPDKKYIFVPMSVDLRPSQKEADKTFFNHWSLMPLAVSRSIIQEGMESAVPHLKTLYAEALSARLPQLFFQAAEAMKYIPYRAIDLLTRLQPGKTLGTFMFSFLNSGNSRSGEIINFSHYPQMPTGSSLGIFVNLCNDNLNIIISRRPWKGDECFGNFLQGVKMQLLEEVK